MNNSADTLFRQWSMLRAIPRAPRKVSTTQLGDRLGQEGFAVHARTIQRDLVKLSAAFPLVCDERERPFGWSWMADADPLDIPAMSAQSALTLRLAGDFLPSLLPPSTLRALEPHLRRADEVLAALSHDMGSWPDRVRIISATQPFRPPDVDPNVLECVYTALSTGRALAVDYRKRGAADLREYAAHPLALVGRDNVIYLVASLWDYDNVVQLALHRIAAAHMTDAPARQIPFDLDAYIERGEFGFLLDEAPIRLVLRAAPEVVQKLTETPLCPTQTLAPGPEPATTVTATVADTSQLRAWLLSYGALVEVVEPPTLRAAMRARLREAADAYG